MYLAVLPGRRRSVIKLLLLYSVVSNSYSKTCYAMKIFYVRKNYVRVYGCFLPCKYLI